MVPNVAGPSIDQRSPVAKVLDTEVVSSFENSEISILSPNRTPRVPSKPILRAFGINTPPIDQNIVIGAFRSSLVLKDSSSVGVCLKLVSH